MLREDQIPDLMLLTLKNYELQGFTDYFSKIQNYKMYEYMQKNSQGFNSAKKITFRAMVNHNHTARSTGYYAKNTHAQLASKFVDAEFGFAMFMNDMIIDQREVDVTQGADALVDRTLEEKVAMMTDFVETLNLQYWCSPEDVNDRENMSGAQYWITTSDQQGFYGGNPDGFVNGKAGINADIYDKARNYTDTFISVSDEDLLAKMDRAVRHTQFNGVIDHSKPQGKGGCAVFITDGLVEPLKKLMRDSNANVGACLDNADLSMSNIRLSFNGNPIIWDPGLDMRRELQDDTKEYVYMFNFSSYKNGYRKGWLEHWKKPKEVADMDFVYSTRVDTICNPFCTNLREQSVICSA